MMKPWFVWSADAADAEAAKAEIARLVDGTVDRTDRVWAVTDGGDFVIAVTGCGPRSEAHAKMIVHMHSAINVIERGPIVPPPDPGAHSWEAYANFWRAEAQRYIEAARAARYYFLIATDTDETSATPLTTPEHVAPKSSDGETP